MLPQIAFPGGLICGLDCDSAHTSTPGPRACAERIVCEFHAVSSPGRVAANVLTDVRHQVAVVLQRRERGGGVGRAATCGRRDSLDESLGSSVDNSRNDWGYVEVVEVIDHSSSARRGVLVSSVEMQHKRLPKDVGRWRHIGRLVLSPAEGNGCVYVACIQGCLGRDRNSELRRVLVSEQCQFPRLRDAHLQLALRTRRRRCSARRAIVPPTVVRVVKGTGPREVGGPIVVVDVAVIAQCVDVLRGTRGCDGNRGREVEPIVEVRIGNRAVDAIGAGAECRPGCNLGPPPEYDITRPERRRSNLCRSQRRVHDDLLWPNVRVCGLNRVIEPIDERFYVTKC